MVYGANISQIPLTIFYKSFAMPVDDWNDYLY